MTRIDRYEIETEIGRGRTGVVYLAHDPRLERRVALRTLHLAEELSPEQRRERRAGFLHAARAASSLVHPGVVAIHDVGESGHTPYLVMEYIPGNPLRELLEGGPLDPAEAFFIADRAAEALGAAHAAGIVHRDLTPADILLHERDHAVKVADFGLAHPSGAAAYASPEQIRGESQDGRSDLFSLATILYQMLCGEWPFSGSDSSRMMPICSRVPGLPSGLDRFFERALDQRPAERFVDAASFKEALCRARADPADPDRSVTSSEAFPVSETG